MGAMNTTHPSQHMNSAFDDFRVARQTALYNRAPSFQYGGATYVRGETDGGMVVYRGAKAQKRSKRRMSPRKARAKSKKGCGGRKKC